MVIFLSNIYWSRWFVVELSELYVMSKPPFKVGKLSICCFYSL